MADIHDHVRGLTKEIQQRQDGHVRQALKAATAEGFGLTVEYGPLKFNFAESRVEGTLTACPDPTVPVGEIVVRYRAGGVADGG